MPKQYRDEDGKVRAYVDAKLAAGSTVVLADGTEVALVDGTSVALAAGTEVIATVKGSNGEQDLRGLHANRPAADAVPVGSTYWSVNEPALPGTVYVTDGTNWATLEVL